MTIFIISLVMFIAAVIYFAFTWSKDNTNDSVDTLFIIAFGVGLIFSIIGAGCTWGAKSDEALWNDMAANPICYSTESLAKAHKDIVTSKYWATTPFGFHKGYDFPEIDPNVMENTTKYHFVR